MRVYEASSVEQEFDVAVTLRLMPDGRFSNFRSYSSYGGGFVGEVHGRWRHDAGTIFLLPESVGKFINPHDWIQGQERTGVENDGCLTFIRGEDLYLRHENDPSESATG